MDCFDYFLSLSARLLRHIFWLPAIFSSPIRHFSAFFGCFSAFRFASWPLSGHNIGEDACYAFASCHCHYDILPCFSIFDDCHFHFRIIAFWLFSLAFREDFHTAFHISLFSLIRRFLRHHFRRRRRYYYAIFAFAQPCCFQPPFAFAWHFRWLPAFELSFTFLHFIWLFSLSAASPYFLHCGHYTFLSLPLLRHFGIDTPIAADTPP